MNRIVSLAVVALVGAACAATSPAAIIHESATLGETGVPGSVPATYWDQFLGSRFSLDETVDVESVGCHIVGVGTFFAAIVSLTGPDALPSGYPFDTTPKALAVFGFPKPSADVLVPLSVTLNPGYYALIIGSGQFDASGAGGMPDNNVDIPGAASYIRWSREQNPWTWSEYPGGGLRFVVTGHVIPEPASGGLVVLGILCLCALARRV